MASTSPVPRRFELDLGALWRELLGPWRDMHSWPWLRWLTPQVPVRLLRADGSEAVWLGAQARTGKSGTRIAGAFTAIELPEDLLLRRRLAVPAMPDQEVANAAELEVRGVSPFATDDLVWGFACAAGRAGGIEVETAMASRRQVIQYLASRNTSPSSQAGMPEVWAISSRGTPILFAGFGEARRARNAVIWRRVGYGLLALALALAAALALTPMAQLHMRAMEATAAFNELAKRSAPPMAQRENLIKSTGKLSVLSGLLAETVDPLVIMDLLTQVLPDDTFLTILQVQGRKITISGQANNAAALMQHLSAQPTLRDVRAPTAALRQLGAPKESFNIEFTLDAKAYAPTLKPASAFTHPAEPVPGATAATNSPAADMKTAPAVTAATPAMQAKALPGTTPAAPPTSPPAQAKTSPPPPPPLQAAKPAAGGAGASFGGAAPAKERGAP